MSKLGLVNRILAFACLTDLNVISRGNFSCMHLEPAEQGSKGPESFRLPSPEHQEWVDKEAAADPEMHRFERWLLDNGATFPRLTMQTYGDEVRGVSALVDIEPESTIVTVPLKCLITVEMGKATDVGQAVLAADPTALQWPAGGAVNAHTVVVVPP